MAEYLIQDSTLTDIADAIRAKDGSSAPILTEDMADAIAAIPSGGGDYTYIEHYQYVQAETKDYNSGGFTNWFVQTYLNNGDGLYWGTINDVTGNVSQYKAVAFYAIKIPGTTRGDFKRPINWMQDISNQVSFYVYAGAIIDIWFVPKTHFDT